MTGARQPPKRASKADRKNALLAKFQEWLNNGDTAEEAIARFTPAQYDFLIDCDVDFDSLTMTPQQLATVKAMTKAPRTVKPGGYNKQYPQEKQDLYNALVALIESRGGEIQPRQKQNFRDLDFTIQGTAYKIVLSNPRK